MLKNFLIAVVSAAGLGASADGALALNTQSWVSGTGTGFACTRSAPCATINDAIVSTVAGGVVSVLDPIGGSNAFVVTKSLTIRAEGVDAGPEYSESSNGPNISITAGPNDVVTLVGLQSNGGGIQVNSVGHLHVVNCRIGNQTADGSAGINFVPNSPAKLSVTDTVISNVGTNTGGGIVIKPVSGGSARVNLERVIVNGNAFGVAVDGSNSTAGINMTIADSMIGGNKQDGIVATTSPSGAPIGVYVTNTKSVNNNYGIRSIGNNVTVRVDNSKIIGNGTGLSGGGALLTGGGNTVQANGTNGGFTGPYAQQ